MSKVVGQELYLSSRNLMIVIGLLTCSALLDVSLAFGQGLPFARARLVELIAYVSVAHARCGFEIDVELIGEAIRREGMTFGGMSELVARDRALASAGLAFAGSRSSFECISAYRRFGPNGSEVQGLLERRAPPSPVS